MKVFLVILVLFFSACSDYNDDTQVISEKLQSNALDSSKTINQQNSLNVIDNNINANSIEEKSDSKTLYTKCISCHGEKGDIVAPGSKNNILIMNLSRDEIINSLKGYRNKTISKSKTAAIMYLQSSNLSDSDIEILGDYISNFK